MTSPENIESYCVTAADWQREREDIENDELWEQFMNFPGLERFDDS